MDIIKKLEKFGVIFIPDGNRVTVRLQNGTPNDVRQFIIENREILRVAILSREQQLRDYVACVSH